MAHCRYAVTFDFDEVTKINAVNYELAEHYANIWLHNQLLTTGEKSKAFIFQDGIQIAIITN